MVKERVREIVDFATSSSPYQKANKGWLTDDIYLQIGASEEDSSRAGKKLIDVFVFWEPLKQLVSILFFTFSLALILIVSAISYKHGHFEIPLPASFISNNVAELKTDYSPQDEIEEFELEDLKVADTQAEEEEISNNTISNELDRTSQKTEVLIQNESEPKSSKSLGTAGNLF